MSSQKHFPKALKALPLITSLAVALSLFLAHSSVPASHGFKKLQQDSPPPVNPGEKDDKTPDPPSDDPKGNNPITPPAEQENKPPPNQPPEPEGRKPMPEPGVPSIPE
jgi:hypothetical protein